MHLCCLGCFVVASFRGYRKVYSAFTCPCCHVWRPPESGSFHNCKKAKGLLPGNVTCGSTNGTCPFAMPAALASRKAHSAPPALHHTTRAFCASLFLCCSDDEQQALLHRIWTGDVKKSINIHALGQILRSHHTRRSTGEYGSLPIKEITYWANQRII